jgi:hypothetical protein
MNTHFKNTLLTAVTTLSIVFASEARAADVAPPPETSDWVFTGAAYLWASGLEGSTGVLGFPAVDVDLSFGDILENLDGALMGVAELRNGSFSIGVDLSYASLSANVDTPLGIAANDVDVSAKTFMGTAVLGYSVIDMGTFNLDLIAGGRLWSVSNDFDFNGGLLGGTHAGDEATWLDPLVGAKFHAGITENTYVSGWGMIGGFGVASDMMWDVMGGIGYNVTDSFSVFGGYRAVSVDYSDDGFVYDVVQQGPIFAGVFHF